MSDFNHDSYCGIYCGACSIMISYRTGNKDPLAQHLNEENVRATLAAYGGEYPEGEPFSHTCNGCKTATLFINCRPCKIRKCAVEKKFEHCIECGEYPCQLFSATMCNPQVQQVLPHTKMPVKNLDRIREIGVTQWLAEQGKQWKCPECQTTFSWYADSCTNCGHVLADAKDYNKV